MAEIPRARWCETCRRYGDHGERGHTPENAATVHCPDGGACHHECKVRCWRVGTCGPLGAAQYPGDQWPIEVLRKHAPERLPESHVDERSSLNERLIAAGISGEDTRRDVAQVVHDWLLSYVPYGLDPTEPLAELEGK